MIECFKNYPQWLLVVQQDSFNAQHANTLWFLRGKFLHKTQKSILLKETP